jgi:predicted CxxxxCH...CXXCH cytochrome family protein
MKTPYLFLALFALLSGLLVSSCTELKTDLPSSPGTSGIHGPGWSEKASANFHGTWLKSKGYDLSKCATCHSSSFTGGTSGVSCGNSGCHVDLNGAPKSPASCNTCHGTFAGLAGDTVSFAPPQNTGGDTAVTARGVGGHWMHLAGTRIAVPLRCGDCHNVPASLFASGHLDSPLPAEVQINSVRGRTVTNEPTTDEYDSALPLFTPNPTYDPVTGKCSNVYCHGNFKNGNTTNAPMWTAARGTQAVCGSCHGDVTKSDPVERAWPKSESQGGSHLDFFAGAACADCHDGVVDANMVIIDSTKHMNGKLNVFGGEGDY